ncbi:hypothetical protein ACGGZK_05260 [Agromyces sp. MMS24-K17]|uniref:hypothetical protein n=1 Tax=Agromyces sp. MMS24-K17 TaxID=3372850 RepID=UPI003754BE44
MQSGRGRRRRLVAGGIAAVATVAVLTGAAFVGVRAGETAAASAELAAARTSLAAALDGLDADLATAGETAEDGRALHAESAGRTLDEATREALATELASLETATASADAEAGTARTTLDGEGAGGDADASGAAVAADASDASGAAPAAATAGLALPLADLPGLLIADPATLRLAADRLGAASDAVDDVSEALRDRIADTASAADAVRAAIGERDAWLAGIRANAYHETVWAAGWTPELDECRGSVDLTGAYGVPTIAEHWSCTGKDFPRDAGTYVVLDGLDAGTYRVDGVAAVLDQDRHTTADLPRGHDLLYQTCLGGDSSTMALVALTRVD